MKRALLASSAVFPSKGHGSGAFIPWHTEGPEKAEGEEQVPMSYKEHLSSGLHSPRPYNTHTHILDQDWALWLQLEANDPSQMFLKAG